MSLASRDESELVGSSRRRSERGGSLGTGAFARQNFSASGCGSSSVKCRASRLRASAGTPVIQPPCRDLPYWRLNRKHALHMGTGNGPSRVPSKVFQGFCDGALITAILAAIAFFVYGNPAAVLAQWRAMTAATPATRTTTDTRLLRQPFRLRLRLKHYHVRATQKRLRLPRLSPTRRAIRKRVAQPFQRPRTATF